MLLAICGTEWPTLCWCAVKKLLTHSLVYYLCSEYQMANSASLYMWSQTAQNITILSICMRICDITCPQTSQSTEMNTFLLFCSHMFDLLLIFDVACSKWLVVNAYSCVAWFVAGEWLMVNAYTCVAWFVAGRWLMLNTYSSVAWFVASKWLMLNAYSCVAWFVAGRWLMPGP